MDVPTFGKTSRHERLEEEDMTRGGAERLGWLRVSVLDGSCRNTTTMVIDSSNPTTSEAVVHSSNPAVGSSGDRIKWEGERRRSDRGRAGENNSRAVEGKTSIF